MAPIRNIVIDQGTTFTMTVVVSDLNGNELDLTHYSARAQMRRSYGSNTAIEFTSEISNDPTSGELTISLTDQETSDIKSGRYVYDIEIVNSTDNKVTRVIEGIVTVTPEVTR